MNKTKVLTSLIAVWLLYGSGAGLAPAIAQTNSETQRLGQYETVVFGEEHNRDKFEKRLQALEKSLIGKAGNGPTSTRLDELGKLVQGKSSSEYLPAIPPVMDRSQFMKEPEQAPRRSETAAAPLYDEAPPAAESGERVTGMLREAMKLYSAGKLNEAERVYRSVLAIDFRNPDANFNLGAIAEDKGDLKSAVTYYRTALRNNPDDDELKDALASVEKKLKIAEAAKAPTQDNPASDPAMKQIASDAAAEYKKGDFDAAIAKLNYLAKRSPYDANVQFALGQAWRGKGNNNEAVKHLRAAATLNPKNELYVKTANQVQSESPGQQQPQQPLTASNDEDRPVGEITPFTGASEDHGRGSSRNMDLGDIAAGLLRGQRYSDGMPMSGSVDAYGRSSGGGFPGGISLGFGGGSGNLRVRRAIQSGLAGAAIGAMSSRGRPGGMSKGAMRGAMYGGLFGLMTGGY